MKRATLIGALIASFAVGTTAMADGRGSEGHGHDNRGHDSRGHGDYRGRADGYRHDYRPGPSVRFEFRAPERHDYRWHDSYVYRPHEHYSYAPRYYVPRYYGHRWARGERLPVEYYGSPYVIEDYRGFGLGIPPRGYHWVRVNGDAVLAAVATGIVLDAVFHAFN